jgi:hypothetical protein
MTKPHNPSAFPHLVPHNPDFAYSATGMTLRDYFAAKIINGYISDPTSTNRPFAEVAEWAYKFADAMIEARTTTQED